MALSEICGCNKASRMISGVSFCDDCFNTLCRIREGELTTIDYYRNLQMASEGMSERALHHMKE